MTARWTIVTPAPKTAACPACKVKRNRLSVYPTSEGKRCYTCLRSDPSDHHNIIGERIAATEARRIAAYRDSITCSSTCRRLPRHHGNHRPVRSALAARARKAA